MKWISPPDEKELLGFVLFGDFVDGLYHGTLPFIHHHLREYRLYFVPSILSKSKIESMPLIKLDQEWGLTRGCLQDFLATAGNLKYQSNHRLGHSDIFYFDSFNFCRSIILSHCFHCSLVFTESACKFYPQTCIVSVIATNPAQDKFLLVSPYFFSKPELLFVISHDV